MYLWRNLNALSDCRPAAGSFPAPGRRCGPKGSVQDHLQRSIRLLYEERAHLANAQELLDRPKKLLEGLFQHVPAALTQQGRPADL